MIETLFYLGIVFAAVVALANWRNGLYLCVVFDVLRDPVRKLAETNSVAITVAGAALWLAVALGAYAARGEGLFVIGRQYPRLRKAFLLLLVGLMPAAIMSTVLYPRGLLLAAIGFASYSAPFLGMVIGYSFTTNRRDLLRFMAFYCVVNGITLSGTLFEFFKYDIPALGGIKMIWLRFKPGYIVELICGFYRSPDVMGLHAAFVAMFAVTLAIVSRSHLRFLWFTFAVWGTTCLLLSGRRKMIAMLLVYVAVFLLLKMRQTGVSALMTVTAGAAILLGGVYIFTQQVDVNVEYLEYAGTTLEDAGDRIQTNVIGASIGTAQLSGAFGYGLGVATQGGYYAGGHGQRIWQEDGASRLFAEVGWIGAALIAVALIQLGIAANQALSRITPRRDLGDLMFGLAGIVAACAGSFIVSHQAFSGDPSSLMLASMVLGCFFRGPTLPLEGVSHVTRSATMEDRVIQNPASGTAGALA